MATLDKDISVFFFLKYYHFLICFQVCKPLKAQTAQKSHKSQSLNMKHRRSRKVRTNPPLTDFYCWIWLGFL